MWGHTVRAQFETSQSEIFPPTLLYSEHRSCMVLVRGCNNNSHESNIAFMLISWHVVPFLEKQVLLIPFPKKILCFCFQGFSWTVKMSLYERDHFVFGVDSVKEQVKRFDGFFSYNSLTLFC